MTSDDIRSGELGVPIMLWIRDDHGYNLTCSDIALQRHHQIMIVDSLEKGVETLVHQPVDILVVDRTILRDADSELLIEIERCWPYLICLVLNEGHTSGGNPLANYPEFVTELDLPEDAGRLEKMLLSGLWRVDDKSKLH